jgi:hypothetical protein
VSTTTSSTTTITTTVTKLKEKLNQDAAGYIENIYTEMPTFNGTTNGTNVEDTDRIDSSTDEPITAVLLIVTGVLLLGIIIGLMWRYSREARMQAHSHLKGSDSADSRSSASSGQPLGNTTAATTGSTSDKQARILPTLSNAMYLPSPHTRPGIGGLSIGSKTAATNSWTYGYNPRLAGATPASTAGLGQCTTGETQASSFYWHSNTNTGTSPAVAGTGVIYEDASGPSTVAPFYWHTGNDDDNADGRGRQRPSLDSMFGQDFSNGYAPHHTVPTPAYTEDDTYGNAVDVRSPTPELNPSVLDDLQGSDGMLYGDFLSEDVKEVWKMGFEASHATFHQEPTSKQHYYPPNTGSASPTTNPNSIWFS